MDCKMVVEPREETRKTGEIRFSRVRENSTMKGKHLPNWKQNEDQMRRGLVRAYRNDCFQFSVIVLVSKYSGREMKRPLILNYN